MVNQSQQLSLQELINRIKVLGNAIDFLNFVTYADEARDIAFRLKTFQNYNSRKMNEIFLKLNEALKRIDAPEVKRAEVPYVARDALKHAGLGTQVPLGQEQARVSLRKAYQAAEAAVQYYQENPDKPFDLKKTTDIVYKNLVKRKNGEHRQ